MTTNTHSTQSTKIRIALLSDPTGQFPQGETLWAEPLSGLPGRYQLRNNSFYAVAVAVADSWLGLGSEYSEGNPGYLVTAWVETATPQSIREVIAATAPEWELLEVLTAQTRAEWICGCAPRPDCPSATRLRSWASHPAASHN
jgi:hypothetical protein